MSTNINDEGVVALIGLILLTLPSEEVRIPDEFVARGLPDGGAVRVYHDDFTDELVISIHRQDSE